MFTPRTTDASKSSAAKNDNEPFFKSRVQTKLAIGRPGDRYEQEADRTADTVVAGLKEPQQQKLSAAPTFFTPKPAVQSRQDVTLQPKEEGVEEIQEKPLAESLTPVAVTSLGGSPVQEKCASCGATEEKLSVQSKCAKCEAAEAGKTTVQTKCAECEAKEKEAAAGGGVVQKCEKCEAAEKEKTTVQTKCAECEANEKAVKQHGGIVQKCEKCAAEEQAVQTKGGQAASTISTRLKASKGGGSAMDSGTQQSMSSGFGADFSNVRIHTGSEAVQMNRELGSHAFTNGSDIYFNSGKYDPGSESGQHLLAHELTHTVQQGAASPGVQKKTDETIVQKEGNACTPPQEQGSQAAARSAETAPSNPNCAPSNPPAPQPPAGQQEPQEEESPASVEAREGSPVEERQSNAPPPGEGGPGDEQGIQQGAQQGAEQSLDPCAQRKQQTGAQGGAAQTPQAPSGGLAPQQNQASQGTGGQPAAEGQPVEGQAPAAEGQQQESSFLAATAERGVSPLVQAEGLGEEASPELMEERDQTLVSAETATTGLMATKASAEGLAAAGAHYLLPPKASQRAQTNRDAANAKVASFMLQAGERIGGLITNGMTLASGIRGSIEENKAMLLGDIDAKRQSVSGFFAQAKANASAKAQTAKANLAGQHAVTLLQIEMSAAMANLQVSMTHQNKSNELSLAYTAQLAALSQAYTTGYNNLISSGNTKGAAVESFAATKAAAYRRAEGASGEIQRRVQNHEKDGFWDGYLSYNRYMARANAATEVGKQYKDGMISQARSQADRMMCGQAKDNEFMGAIFQKGNEMLGCSLQNAQDAINRQKQAAIMQATHTHQQMSATIDQSLAATMAQLSEKEAIQLQLLNDYGIRQLMAIERDGEQSIATALEGINKAVGQLVSFLTIYKQTVDSSEAPKADVFSQAQMQVEAQFSQGVTQAEGAIAAAVSAGQLAVTEGGNQVMIALQQLYDTGISDAQQLMSSFESSTDALVVSGTGIFAQILAATTQSIQGEQLNGVNTITGVTTGVTGLLTNIATGATSKFTEARTAMETGMQRTIDSEVTTKICNEAEKAAADVQPWWKTALKILLVIVVIVVVALVIGPAVIGAVGAAASALAGSVGAGAALAGTIGAWAGPIIGGAIVGALSGAVIQVGNNLIDIAGTDQAMNWQNVTKGVAGAMVAGAIGGALGGLGGQFAQVLLGRLGSGLSAGWRFAADFGINAAFDVVGSIVGDMGSCAVDASTCHPFSWQSLLMGMAIGGAVQISMGGLSALARPRGGAHAGAGGTQHVGAEAPGGGRTTFGDRVRGAARRVEDFQGRMMEAGQNFGSRAGFGSRAPNAATVKQNIQNANTRMQEGEFFPTRPQQETTAPRGGADANAQNPHPQQEGGPRPHEEGGADAHPRQEGPETRPQDQTTTNREVLDPAHAPENNAISHQQIESEQNWVQSNANTSRRSSVPGYTEEIELPNGHVWRKSERGGWCRFSANPILTKIPHELFTMNLDLLDMRNRVIVPGMQIHQELAILEQNLRARYEASSVPATANRNLLATRTGFLVRGGDGTMYHVTYGDQSFQSGYGLKPGLTTRQPDLDPHTYGVGSLVEQTVPMDKIREHIRMAGGDMRLELDQTGRGAVNISSSTDFHSERAYYKWLRQNTDQFAAAVRALNIKNPVLLAAVLDMASTRYVCSVCAVSGTNLASNTTERTFIHRLRESFGQVMQVDADLSVKVRASAGELFPANKVMPTDMGQIESFLRMNSGTAAVDFPVGQMDYKLLEIAMELRKNPNSTQVNDMINQLKNDNLAIAQEMQRRQMAGLLEPKIENLRTLTPLLCTR